MANPLTGDFEAVIHISVRQINGLLATLHQNRSIPQSSPTFLHSGTLRVGTLPAAINPHLLPLGDWVRKVSASLATRGTGRNLLAALQTVPPGAAKRLKEALGDWHSAVNARPSSSEVRGLAQVQISTPLVSLAPGATDEVVVSTYARAHHRPDPGSLPLPAPIHGEVWVAYRVQRTGGNRLVVSAPADDAKIDFVPATGTMNSTQAKTIAREVRKLVRGDALRANPIQLPGDFPFAGFIAIGSAINRQQPGDQAIALPLRLSSPDAAQGNLHSITTPLVSGTDDFAIAISREFIEVQLAPVTAQMRDHVAAIRVWVSGPLGSTVYRGSLTSGPTLQWAAGSLTIFARADFKTDSVLPDQWVTFSQKLKLSFDALNQIASLQADGEPAVQSSACLDHDDIVGRVKAARDVGLSIGNATLNQWLTLARERLRRGLRSFDDSATLRFRSVEFTAHGIVLRGAIDTRPRKPAQAVLQPFSDDEGAGFTALESWVPGGRVTQYTWSLARQATFHILGTPVSYTIPWRIERKHFPPDRHRFRIQHGTGSGLEIEQYSSVCLSIDGLQVTPGGYSEEVQGFGSLGGSCVPARPEPVVVLPPGWAIFKRPIWWPDWPDLSPLEDGILGHLNCIAEAIPAEGFAANHLIHFVDWRADRPLAGLLQALSIMRRQRHSLAAVLVFPEGTLRESRQEMERRLGLDDVAMIEEPRERSPVHFQITEDVQGGWSQVFGAKKAPASYLINARGEFVWSQERKFVPEDLAAALDEFLLPAPAPESRLISLAVRVGERAAALELVDQQLSRMGEGGLRGRPAIVCFAQTWSSPCLRELSRLQALLEGGIDPVIVGVCGDPTGKAVDGIHKQLGLAFPLLHDAGHVVSSALKVTCWPTTLYLSAESMLEHVQYGCPPARVLEAIGRKSKAGDAAQAE